MNKDVEFLKELFLSKMSTGRTTRMIFSAAENVILGGRTVVIVCKNRQEVERVRCCVLKYFNELISNNIIVSDFNTHSQVIKNLHDIPVVLYDHFCFEQDLIDLMEKYTKHDGCFNKYSMGLK